MKRSSAQPLEAAPRGRAQYSSVLDRIDEHAYVAAGLSPVAIGAIEGFYARQRRLALIVASDTGLRASAAKAM